MRTQKRNRILVLLGGFMVALIAALSARQIWSSQLPPLAIPLRIAPDPNAFDTLTLAHKKLVKKFGTADIEKSWLFSSTSKLRSQMGTLSDRTALVRENVESIRLVRVALSQEYLAPIDFRIEDPLPHLPKSRELSHILLVAAQLAFDSRQWRAGAEYCCDAIQLGQLITTNDYAFTRLAGLSRERTPRQLLADYADYFQGQVLEETLKRLDVIESRREPLDVALENDRVASQVWIYSLSNKSPSEIAEVIGSTRQAWIITFASKRAASAAADEYYARAKYTAGLPYDKATSHVPRPTDPISDAILPDMAHALFSIARHQTERMLLHAYLWLRLNGPVSELPSRFIDPFGKGQRLRYRRSATTFTVYSVGPDGVDDSGATLSKTAGTSALPISTGDMSMTGAFSVGTPNP